MKHLVFACACVVGLALCLFAAKPLAQEKVVFSTPQTFAAPDTITEAEPVTLIITRQVTGYTLHPNITVILAPRKSGGMVIPGAPMVFEYPNPAVAALDTDAEVTTLIGQLKAVNLSVACNEGTGAGNLWQRIQFFLNRDFPSRFNGGGTICS